MDELTPMRTRLSGLRFHLVKDARRGRVPLEERVGRRRFLRRHERGLFLS
jgi:hypothetical protein